MDVPDHFTTDEMLRIEALDRAVRVSMAKNNAELNDAIVDRAEKFYAFLSNTPQGESTIATHDEAKKLPINTVIRDADGDFGEKIADDAWGVFNLTDRKPSSWFGYPLKVVYRPAS